MEYVYPPLIKYVVYALCFYMFNKLQFKTLQDDMLIQIITGSVILVICVDYLFINKQPSLIPKFIKEQFIDNESEDDFEDFDVDSVIEESIKKQEKHNNNDFYPEQLGSPVDNNSCANTFDSVTSMTDMPMYLNEPPQHAINNTLLPHMQMY